MPTVIEVFDLSRILVPVQHPEDARWDSVAWGPNLTVLRGTFAGQKTADMKMYPFVSGAGDGTQTARGIAMYDFMTDANGKVFYGPSTTPSARAGPWMTSPLYIRGIFDSEELQTAVTPAGEVDTFTPANVAVGNVFTLTATQKNGTTTTISYTAAATTAADVVTGLTALINASIEEPRHYVFNRIFCFWWHGDVHQSGNNASLRSSVLGHLGQLPWRQGASQRVLGNHLVHDCSALNHRQFSRRSTCLSYTRLQSRCSKSKLTTLNVVVLVELVSISSL